MGLFGLPKISRRIHPQRRRTSGHTNLATFYRTFCPGRKDQHCNNRNSSDRQAGLRGLHQLQVYASWTPCYSLYKDYSKMGLSGQPKNYVNNLTTNPVV